MNDLNEELDYLEKQKIEYEKFLKEEAIKLELNKVYIQESHSWAKMHYKIIFIDEKIAVGLKVFCGIYNSDSKGCGEYCLFKSNTGEKYQDIRLNYRLKELVK